MSCATHNCGIKIESVTWVKLVIQQLVCAGPDWRRGCVEEPIGLTWLGSCNSQVNQAGAGMDDTLGIYPGGGPYIEP
jgi:hypothetical protein